MDRRRSRRSFLKNIALTLSSIAACDLSVIVGAGKEDAFKVLASVGLKENNMPHVSVKLWPGRSEQTKQRLIDAIVEDVVNVIGCGEESVSVAIEEIDPQDWKEKVYDPLIRRKIDTLNKKPGYSM